MKNQKVSSIMDQKNFSIVAQKSSQIIDQKGSAFKDQKVYSIMDQKSSPIIDQKGSSIKESLHKFFHQEIFTPFPQATKRLSCLTTYQLKTQCLRKLRTFKKNHNINSEAGKLKQTF